MTKTCITAQSDFTFTLERKHAAFGEARDLLMRFAELQKCPEYLHTYRLTKLSLWNAASMGLTSAQLLEDLAPFLRFPLPVNVRTEIVQTMLLWGLLRLEREGESLSLVVQSAELLPHLESEPEFRAALLEPEKYPTAAGVGPFRLPIDPAKRGRVKVVLMKLGLPVEDIAGYQDGAVHSVHLKEQLQLRPYQEESLTAFYQNNSVFGGSGVIVLPCGAGKTIVGMAVMAKLSMQTLILTTNTTALRQWRRELLDKTDLRDTDIGEYSGSSKDIRPVTLATYNILTSRRSKTDSFRHFGLFDAQPWGLIIYDEVHLLPAPVFQATANLQSRRRLGLTATLVREDQKEGDVFSLIGPRKYEVPWKVLEEQGWIARAHCIEISVPFSGRLTAEYKYAPKREQFRRAAVNSAKTEVLRLLLERHANQSILVLGMYLDQIRRVAQELELPLLEGSTSQKQRDEVYAKFQSGELSVLLLSKIGNSSVDLPDAQVAIQISGTFGSRQEEAQRLGRVLRPKKGENQAYFYSLVSAGSREEYFALRRQLFLVEQGYEYEFFKVAEESQGEHYEVC